MMNLMHWRMVVAVADTGNITRAAERVGMTQSGASQALALIEETLGVRLFTRENRQTLPTAIGLPVIEQARTMRDMNASVQTTAKQIKLIAQANVSHSAAAASLLGSLGEIRKILRTRIATMPMRGRIAVTSSMAALSMSCRSIARAAACRRRCSAAGRSRASSTSRRASRCRAFSC